MEKISKRNYFDSIGNIGVKNLPETLKKSHDFVERATQNGNDWTKYDSNEVIQRTIDLYFEKLNEFLRDSPATIKKPEPVKRKEPVVKQAKPVQNKQKERRVKATQRKAAIRTAKEAAKDLIRPYVLRGDSIRQLKDSYMGSTNSEYSASIRGNKIMVDKVNSRKVNESFSLDKLFKEVVSEKGNKLTHNVQLVENLQEEVKFIKRFIGLNNKVKSANAILSFIKNLQKSITMKLIRKTSPYADEIRKIQNNLIQAYELADGQTPIEIDDKYLNRLVAIAGGEAVYPSIGFIKRYIGMQGKAMEAEKTEAFIAQIQKAIEKGTITNEDPYYNKIKAILSNLRKLKPDHKLELSKSELNGLMGIVEGCGCKELSGIEEEPEEARPTGVMNSQDFVKLKFEGLGFTGKWLNFIGDPAKGFTAMVFGKPKFGKSYLCIDFAGYLARNQGKTLYVAKEEELDATLQKKVSDKSVAHPNLDVSDQLPDDLSPYSFVFLDSVSKLGLSPQDLSQLEKQYPNTSFIYIFQVRKDGIFKGKNEFQHDVDVVIEVPEKGLAVQNGRYNQGGEMRIFDSNNQQN